MMVTFVPSHSRPMDPKSSLGLVTRPFEFGMRTQALRCCHCCKTMIIPLIQSHSRPMDQKFSLGLMMIPPEFGIRVRGSNFSHHNQKLMMMYSRLHQTVE